MEKLEAESLKQAISAGLMIGPIREVVPRTVDLVTDFMAQKFGVAMGKADSETYQALAALWKDIISEPVEKSSSDGPGSSGINTRH